MSSRFYPVVAGSDYRLHQAIEYEERVEASQQDEKGHRVFRELNCQNNIPPQLMLEIGKSDDFIIPIFMFNCLFYATPLPAI